MITRAASWAVICLSLVPFHHSLAQVKGKNASVRTIDKVREKLKEILKPGKEADERVHALHRLRAYRYLADVPYEDVSLDPDYSKYALAGSKLCERLKRLEHNPERPEDMPEDEFKIAYIGTSRSSLAAGPPSLPRAVDGWMDDSDPFNIEHLGHRRWCLFPQMQKTGFGRAGIFSAMYVFDRGRKKAPDYEFVCWPARGAMPISFFGPKHAWCVSPNPDRYRPVKEVEPRIYRADAKGDKEGEPLKLNHTSVDMAPFGIPYCIVFRPEEAMRAGGRYVVEIEGMKPLRPGVPATLRYAVEFFE